MMEFSLSFFRTAHHTYHLRVESKAKEIIDTLIEGFVNDLFAWSVGGRKAEAMNRDTTAAKNGMGKILLHARSPNYLKRSLLDASSNILPSFVIVY